MDRVDEMEVFVRVVEARSFRRAASALGLPASTVTDVIKRSEKRLGRRLLDRTTRVVSPTPEGEIWYGHCQRLITDFEDAETAIRDNRPAGRVRLDVNGPLARRFLLPRLSGFLAQYPDLELTISETETFIDLVSSGVDCVLRAGELDDSGLTQRRVGMMAEATMASRSYLEKHGTPETLADLDGHHMVGFFSTRRQAVLPLEFTVDGTTIERHLPVSVSVTGAESLRTAAQLGLGIIQVPRYHAGSSGPGDELVEILPQHPPQPMRLTLLYPAGRRASPRLSVLIDWLASLDYSA